jgi:hypothetical protein
MMRSKALAPVVFVVIALVAVGAVRWMGTRSPGRDATPGTASAPRGGAAPLDARTVESAHYTIATRATDAQTQRVAAAAESLHAAYLATFPEVVARAPTGKFQLVLYRDRADFKAHNRSHAWAEAYYLRPACHAYFAEGERNPTHWMVHEATHQLNRELAGIERVAWVDEGLATYFGTSRLEDGVLRVGTVDPFTYPVWWLSDLAPTGNFDNDVRTARFVPLRAVITGKGGPDLDTHFNAWYVAYWSLTRFLLQHDGGRHAAGYRRVVAEGGTLDAFERHIGPIAEIEPQWYAYLRDQATRGLDRMDEVLVVDAGR